MLLPVALEPGLVFPSQWSFQARYAYNSDRVTIKLTVNTHWGNKRIAAFYVSGMHAGDIIYSSAVEKAVNILLPKLHHCTGEVAGIYNGVVCITLVCIPWIVT